MSENRLCSRVEERAVKDAGGKREMEKDQAESWRTGGGGRRGGGGEGGGVQ